METVMPQTSKVPSTVNAQYFSAVVAPAKGIQRRSYMQQISENKKTGKQL